MIRDLPDGTMVQEAGAYRCSMSHYHGLSICPGPSISSSGLRTIFGQSPWHFWSASELNPNRYPPKEPGEALILGRAAHSLILGDEVFDDHFIYLPKDAPARPTATQVRAFERDGRWSDAAKPGAEFWAEFDARAAGRMLLREEQVERIMRMAENLKANPLAVEMLTGGLTEISMIWQDEATGVWVKSRPDVMPDQSADAGDLKTFSPRGMDLKRAVHRAITDHGYHQQMALAQEGLERVFGLSPQDFVLVFVETTQPFTVIPVRLDAESLHIGRVANRHALDTFARCLESGDWPGPVDGILEYEFPPSLTNRFAEMQADGRLPTLERA